MEEISRPSEQSLTTLQRKLPIGRAQTQLQVRSFIKQVGENYDTTKSRGLASRLHQVLSETGFSSVALLLPQNVLCMVGFH